MDSRDTLNGILKVGNWRRRPPGLIPRGILLGRQTTLLGAENMQMVLLKYIQFPNTYMSQFRHIQGPQIRQFTIQCIHYFPQSSQWECTIWGYEDNNADLRLVVIFFSYKVPEGSKQNQMRQVTNTIVSPQIMKSGYSSRSRWRQMLRKSSSQMCFTQKCNSSYWFHDCLSRAHVT